MAFLLRKMKSGWVRLSGRCDLSGRLYFDSFFFLKVVQQQLVVPVPVQVVVEILSILYPG